MRAGKVGWAVAVSLLLIGMLAAPAWSLIKPGGPAPQLTLPDSQGGEHSLAQMTQGKVALLVWWSLSCPTCQEEMPNLVALAKRFQGNPFVMITINADGKAMVPAVQGYAAQQKLPPPLLLDVGPRDSLPFAEAFDLFTTPGIVVLDSTGKVVLVQEHQVDLEAVTQAIRSAF